MKNYLMAIYYLLISVMIKSFRGKSDKFEHYLVKGLDYVKRL